MTRQTDAVLDRLAATARQTLLRGADGVGRVSAAHRALPELLICGGQRCGTTSMYKALVQQPTIFRPVWRKGVHYFDVDFARGPSWYRAHFPLQLQLDRAASRQGTRALTFESSPYYLFHPLAADRIARTLPEVRLLVLVRDPVERAFSAHAHEYARGYETLGFAAALEAEPRRLRGEEERLRNDPAYESATHRHQAYRARGEYAPQLERVADILGGRERIRVVDSGRFFTEPEATFAGILDWLGVRSQPGTRFEQHNARARSPMDPGLRTELSRHYEPFDTRLRPWLDQPPSWTTEGGSA